MGMYTAELVQSAGTMNKNVSRNTINIRKEWRKHMHQLVKK